MLLSNVTQGYASRWNCPCAVVFGPITAETLLSFCKGARCVKYLDGPHYIVQFGKDKAAEPELYTEHELRMALELRDP